MPNPREKMWPPGTTRDANRPTIGPCADAVGTRPPAGSGPPIRYNAMPAQGANHVVIGTRYANGAPRQSSPWTWISQIGDTADPNSQPRILQNAVRLLEFGGTGPPQTYVVSVIAAEQEIAGGTDAPVTIPNSQTAQAMTEGRIYTRLQIVIEWSTGTGSQPKITLDINSGVVFRVFGTIGRVWLLRFPGPSDVRPIGPAAPTNVELPQTGKITVPATEFFTLTTVQSSVQTNLSPMEGFPGAWQCTAQFFPGLQQQVLVPPFARQVQASQGPGGPVIPAYQIVDRSGAALGSLEPSAGSRVTDREYVPGGSRYVQNTFAGATSPVSVIFGVSQF